MQAKLASMGGGIVLEVAIYFTACFYNLVEVKRAKIRGAEAHKFTSRLALGSRQQGCQNTGLKHLKKNNYFKRDVEIMIEEGWQSHGQ
jgi:hypothetical protein